MKKQIYKFFELYNSGSMTYSYNWELLKGLRFIFNDGIINHTWIILMRKNDLDKKPPLYLFDLTTKQYVSSLYPTGEPNTFIFDYSNKSYLLRVDNNQVMIEEL